MRHLTAVLLGLLVCLTLSAQTSTEHAQHAVVRLPSHGASATVISTGPGRTLLLGCAHAYRGADATKPMRVDAPSPAPGSKRTGGIRLLAVDHRLDLSLVEMGIGPLPYCCPVAPAGHRPGRLLSVGYDDMRTPATVRTATMLSTGPVVTWTREPPWHGRSGGGLIDADAGVLVGVVQAYEVVGGRPARGIYASHQAILTFLGRVAPQSRPIPRTREEYAPTLPPPAGWDDCPDGNCPLPAPAPVMPGRR